MAVRPADSLEANLMAQSPLVLRHPDAPAAMSDRSKTIGCVVLPPAAGKRTGRPKRLSGGSAGQIRTKVRGVNREEKYSPCRRPKFPTLRRRGPGLTRHHPGWSPYHRVAPQPHQSARLYRPDARPEPAQSAQAEASGANARTPDRRKTRWSRTQAARRLRRARSRGQQRPAGQHQPEGPRRGGGDAEGKGLKRDQTPERHPASRIGKDLQPDPVSGKGLQAAAPARFAPAPILCPPAALPPYLAERSCPNPFPAAFIYAKK